MLTKASPGRGRAGIGNLPKFYSLDCVAVFHNLDSFHLAPLSPMLVQTRRCCRWIQLRKYAI